jgi:hypothetical protein
MALEMQDLMALKSMGNEGGMTPYEQYKVGFMQAKKPSNAAITSLVIGSGALLVGVTGWVFAGMQASAKGKEAKEAAIAAKDIAATQYAAALQLMNQQNTNTNATLDRVIRGLERETDARVAGDINLTNTVTDSQTGSQASQLTAAQQAELAASQATQQVMMQTFSDAVTGKSSLNPTPVMIYSAPQPCSCPGCGCNG